MMIFFFPLTFEKKNINSSLEFLEHNRSRKMLMHGNNKTGCSETYHYKNHFENNNALWKQ